MTKITADELQKVLENHKHWINEDCDGWQEMRADLSGADLSEANFVRARLSGADLEKTDLTGADFTGADLRKVNLRGANLGLAIFTRADLRGANLLTATFNRTDFAEANLEGTNLGEADLNGSDFTGAKNIPFIPLACPDSGEFIGWKKVYDNESKYIVQLLIPADAKRSSATTSECRCSKAKVVSIVEIGNPEHTLKSVVNSLYAGTVYEVGEIVHPDSYDDNRWHECTHGIHFFVNKQEAIDY